MQLQMTDAWDTWARLEWDVCQLPARATIEGSLLTNSQWQARLSHVEPVITVPWGPSGLYWHDVPVPTSGARNTMTLSEAVAAVSVHFRRMRATLSELASVLQLETKHGTAATVATVANACQRKQVTPQHLLGAHTRWGGVAHDSREPQYLVLKLV